MVSQVLVRGGRLLAVLLLSICGFAVSTSAQAGEIIIHVSDTHISAVDSSLTDHTADLQGWVSEVNTIHAHYALAQTVNTGDLVDDVSTESTRESFELYMDTVAGLAMPHLYVPGNHDYQGPVAYGYAALGYPTYPVAGTNSTWIVGSDATDNGLIDYERIAANIKAGRGHRAVIILQHHPFYTPNEFACEGGPCTAPKWLLSDADQKQFRNLAATYDVIAFLAGHVHGTYYGYDATGGFQTIIAPSLPSQNSYLALTVEGERLAPTQVRLGQRTVIITAPPYYDSDGSGLGLLLDQQPIRVLPYSAQPSQVQFQVGASSSTWHTMILGADGYWQGTYDWTKLSTTSTSLLTVTATYSDGSVVTRSQQIRRSTAYPNMPVAVAVEHANLVNQVVSGVVELGYELTDDAADISQADLFIDGVRRQNWSYGSQGVKKTTLAYAWDTDAEPIGDHTVYLKVTDRFKRVVRTDRLMLSTGVPADVTVNQALGAGWNLISTPVNASSTAIPDVLADLAGQYDLVEAYDGCQPADPWRVYDPAAPEFINTLTAITPGQGVWVHTTGETDFAMTGKPLTSDVTLALCAGWNLIGYPSLTEQEIAAALAPIAGQYDLVEAYDGADPDNPWRVYDPAAPPFVNTLNRFTPGKGYWIHMLAPASLILPR